MRIARRFNAGVLANKMTGPVGTVEKWVRTGRFQPSLRDSLLRTPFPALKRGANFATPLRGNHSPHDHGISESHYR